MSSHESRGDSLNAIESGERLPVSTKFEDWRDNARLLDDLYADGFVRSDTTPLKNGEGAYVAFPGLRLTEKGQHELARSKPAFTETSQPPSRNPRAVFVVHGRNDVLRKSMFEFLRSINLSPIEWSKAVALTGEGAPYIGQILDAAFAHANAIVVLMTPDEIAHLRDEYAAGDTDPETQPAAQARPNVLFEAGMALGRNAKQTVLVEVGEVRQFSDVAGRHAIRITNAVDKRQELAQRLGTAGCDVDLTGTDWHTAGDFTPPPPPGGGLPLGRRLPSVPATLRPRLQFDIKYQARGGNRLGKLQVINRGTETAFDVRLTVPDGAALSRVSTEPIPKIPGGGKSVTLDVMNENHWGVQKDHAFDVRVTARTADGTEVTEEVFLDMNG